MDWRCNCEKIHLQGEGEMHTVRFDPSELFEFGIMYTEVHCTRWCAVVNSQGGMFQLKYGEQ